VRRDTEDRIRLRVRRTCGGAIWGGSCEREGEGVMVVYERRKKGIHAEHKPDHQMWDGWKFLKLTCRKGTEIWGGKKTGGGLVVPEFGVITSQIKGQDYGEAGASNAE